jgi:hypothetical protein
MAQEGRISSEHADKAIKRIEKYTDEIPLEVFIKVQKMIKNIDKYGVACAEWCE